MSTACSTFFFLWGLGWVGFPGIAGAEPDFKPVSINTGTYVFTGHPFEPISLSIGTLQFIGPSPANENRGAEPGLAKPRSQSAEPAPRRAPTPRRVTPVVGRSRDGLSLVSVRATGAELNLTLVNRSARSLRNQNVELKLLGHPPVTTWSRRLNLGAGRSLPLKIHFANLKLPRTVRGLTSFAIMANGKELGRVQWNLRRAPVARERRRVEPSVPVERSPQPAVRKRGL